MAAPTLPALDGLLKAILAAEIRAVSPAIALNRAVVPSRESQEILEITAARFQSLREFLPGIPWGNTHRCFPRYLKALKGFAGRQTPTRDIAWLFVLHYAYQIADSNEGRNTVKKTCQELAEAGHLLTYQETVIELGSSKSLPNNLTRRGKLPSVAIGRQRYFLPQLVRAWISAVKKRYTWPGVQTYSELSRATGVHPKTLSRWFIEGRIAGTKYQNLVRFTDDEVGRIRAVVGSLAISPGLEWLEEILRAQPPSYINSRQTLALLRFPSAADGGWANPARLLISLSSRAIAPGYIQSQGRDPKHPLRLYPAPYYLGFRSWAGDQPATPELLATYRDLCQAGKEIVHQAS